MGLPTSAPYPPPPTLISQGRVSESLVNQLLSESPLCLFTAATVTGSGVGGADRKQKKRSKRKKVKPQKQLVAAAQLKILIKVWRATVSSR